jgi:hypothetical protein
VELRDLGEEEEMGLGPGILAGSSLLDQLEIMGIDPQGVTPPIEDVEDPELEENYDEDVEDEGDLMSFLAGGGQMMGHAPTRTISSVAMSRNLEAP